MIHIAWPWMALVLPLPWMLRRLLPPAGPRAAALFVPLAAEVADQGGAVLPRSSLRVVLAVLTWLSLVAAATRPQWLGEPQPIPTTGRQLLLAVDVSGSMEQRDMAGGLTRLQVVQRVAGDFIERRHGDRVGLILFGSRPYLQAPVTPDLATVRRFLDQAMIGVAGRETALGDAIGLALKRLRANGGQEEAANAVIVLLTDGRNTAGVMPPREAARLAARAGPRIHTIGVGRSGQRGAFGPLTTGSDLDEDTLKDIAHTTGGEYLRATDAAALAAAYRRLDELEPAAGRDRWLRPTEDWFHWPLGLAVLLSVPTVLLGARAWT